MIIIMIMIMINLSNHHQGSNLANCTNLGDGTLKNGASEEVNESIDIEGLSNVSVTEGAASSPSPQFSATFPTEGVATWNETSPFQAHHTDATQWI